MIPMNTIDSQDFLNAACAGAVQLSADDNDLFADLAGRDMDKGITASLRRSYGARIYARGATPTDALCALHRVVGLRDPAPERIETLLRIVGEPRRTVAPVRTGALF
jgi:hypothetical protein